MILINSLPGLGGSITGILKPCIPWNLLFLTKLDWRVDISPAEFNEFLHFIGASGSLLKRQLVEVAIADPLDVFTSLESPDDCGGPTRVVDDQARDPEDVSRPGSACVSPNTSPGSAEDVMRSGGSATSEKSMLQHMRTELTRSARLVAAASLQAQL
eukprot:Rmarinus@m.23979